jgi:hypothetical protein
VKSAGSTSNRPSWHHWLAGEGVGLGEAAGLGDGFGAGKPVGLGEAAGLGQTFGAGNSVGLGQGVELGQGVGLGEGDVIAVGSALWLAYDIGSLPFFLVSTFLTGGLIPSPPLSVVTLQLRHSWIGFGASADEEASQEQKSPRALHICIS